MRRNSFQLGLPLVARELTEQAARRRTYVVRVIYACLLFGAAALLVLPKFGLGSLGRTALLGVGREFFEALVGLEFVGIYLFMPALACGVLTHEKERSTLPLLLLTGLSPRDIVFEKLLSRFVPMLTFLCLSVPLAGLAYTFGGISLDDLPLVVWLALLAILHAGSTAVLCSAWFRTTLGAFVASYLSLLVPYIVSQMCVISQLPTVHWRWMALYLPTLYFGYLQSETLLSIALLSLPILGWSGVCLWLATICLPRRALLPGGNPLLKWFSRLDALFKSLNERLCRGRIVFHEHGTLPDFEPVAWQEIEKSALGSPRFLTRVLLALEVPVCGICFLALPTAMFHGIGTMPTLFNGVWIIVVLLVAVKSASLISAERSRQTLDVLLTTPLTGREILLQKMRGVQMLNWVLRVPLLTILACEFIAVYFADRPGHGLLLQLVAILVDLPMVAWLGCWIGLRCRSQSRAILTTISVLCSWCIVAYYVAWHLPATFVFSLNTRANLHHLVIAISPAKGILLTEPVAYFEYVPLTAGAFCSSLAIWLFFGWRCLNDVNRQLGRTNEPKSDWLQDTVGKLEAQRSEAR